MIKNFHPNFNLLGRFFKYKKKNFIFAELKFKINSYEIKS